MTTRSLRDYLLLGLKGLAMGAADVVPGVSGGTIAFITGIYNELLHSLKSLGPEALKVLVKQGIPSFWKHINGNFLLTVFGGILISLKTFAGLISFCLEHYPLHVWGFFSGLIASSILLLSRDQVGWRWQEWGLCALGAAFVVLISVARPTHLPGDWWVLFFGGFIAICAMILPGISGSFILLLLGLYSEFLNAIKELNFLALGSFGAGCIIGLLVFSRFLSWLLDRHFKPTIAVLIGFLVGSLNVTWPWKEVREVMINRHGESVPLVQVNVLPGAFEQITGTQSHTFWVLIFVGLGSALVLSTEFIALKMSRTPSVEDAKTNQKH